MKATFPAPCRGVLEWWWRISLWKAWDFSVKTNMSRFLERVTKDHPDHIFLVPPCKPWSSLQNLVAYRGGAYSRPRPKTARGRHFLYLVARTFRLQLLNGRAATMEHPRSSAACRTRALSTIPFYYDARVDRCRTGLVARCPSTGELLPVRKATRLRTTRTVPSGATQSSLPLSTTRAPMDQGGT